MRTRNWTVKTLSSKKDPTGGCEHQEGDGCAEKAWFLVSHEIIGESGSPVTERLCEKHAQCRVAKHGIRVPRVRGKSWGHRIELIYSGQRSRCSIKGCRCRTKYVVYYSYRAKGDGRIVSPSRFLCEDHARAFSERHLIDFPGPGATAFLPFSGGGE